MEPEACGRMMTGLKNTDSDFLGKIWTKYYGAQQRASKAFCLLSKWNKAIQP